MLRELERPLPNDQIPESLKPFEDIIDLLPVGANNIIMNYNSGDASLARALDDYTGISTKVFSIDLSDPVSIMPQSKADFALCSGVIEHMNRETRLSSMRTMLDHLNPGGHLVVRFNQEAIKIMASAARLSDMADIVMTPVTAPHDGHQLIFARHNLG